MDNPLEENVEENAPAAQTPALNPDHVPVGTALDWPIVDTDGTLLFAAGNILASPDERNFLFAHFHPQRGDLLDTATQPLPQPGTQADPATPLTLKDMHLEIGALIGVRPQLGSGAPMHPCRIIGFAPNHALFVTPPLHDGRMLPLGLGENIELVAIASHAVFRFVCTVEAICRSPFDYVVLSKPGVIRRLRERKSIRVRTHLAVRFGIGESGQSYEGLGLAKGISALGMSLAASWTLGAVGDRLRLAFRLKSKDLDTEIETTAVIRNVHIGKGPGEPSIHGLELDQLDATQQMAMKVFVFDRQDDVVYWSNGLK
ncbi:flagellar brake protein [Paraburkholderia aromaticivorans]|uniref:Pilus assembly protein PilZ n=1 Tax=Paraburkholderia aromaticivorans TaxID=2026199 RepID=A0A248VQZ8_9BURK|nr:flagellar brake protein [Paraburkholderia aromaticivorans]ASW00790.1 pilus assembly protein PilZ [Paraburkholderia aromaticivorans]